MMLKVQLEVEAANKAIRDGTLSKTMQGVFAKIPGPLSRLAITKLQSE